MHEPDDAPAPPSWLQAYPELKRLARARLHAAGPQAGLNTTALVHESFMRLAGGQVQFPSHGHFYAYAAKVMRSVIVDLIRERQAERRGGAQAAVTLDTQLQEQLSDHDPEALRLHEALQHLASVEPRLAQVVEMRYFGGLSDTEIADALQLTDRTVRRDWDKARALLRELMS